MERAESVPAVVEDETQQLSDSDEDILAKLAVQHDRERTPGLSERLH